MESVASDIRKLIESAPEQIWLDLGENLKALTDDATFRNLSEVTWSEDNATGVGIKYARADVFAEMHEILMAAHIDAVHLTGNEFAISRETVKKIANFINRKRIVHEHRQD